MQILIGKMDSRLYYSVCSLAALIVTLQLTGAKPTSGCQPCQPGNYVAKPCGIATDTTCANCEEGTFTDASNHLSECKKCTKCPGGAYQSKECTSTSDTVCVPCTKLPVNKRADFASCSLDVQNDEMQGDDPNALVGAGDSTTVNDEAKNTENTPAEENAPAEGSKPEETPAEESKPEETPVEESKPEETPVEESKPEETPVEESKPEETPVEESKPEETPVEESKPEETPVEESKPDETPTEESKPEETPTEESKPEETPVEESKPEETATKESKPEETPTEESKPEETPVEESKPEETPVEESKPEETPVNESTPPSGAAAENSTDETVESNDEPALGRSTSANATDESSTPEVPSNDLVMTNTDSSKPPTNDMEPPINETVKPSNETTNPPVENAKPSNETGKPSNETSEPPVEAIKPSNDSVPPPVPEDQSVKPSNESTSNVTAPTDAENDADKSLEADERDVGAPPNSSLSLASPGEEGSDVNLVDVAKDNSASNTTRISTLEELEANEDVSGSDEHELEELEEHHHNETGGHNTGASHSDSEEDDLNKKRTAIIIGVSVGAVAIFALLFFTSRKCRRRGDFKPVGEPVDDGIEFKPLKEPKEADDTNGLYRQGPKMGPPSPRMHRKGDGKFEFPQTQAAPPTKSLDIPNSSRTPISESPLNDPYPNLRYIDESTDDEYSSPKEKLLPDEDNRPSLIVEMSPPSSPATNDTRRDVGGDDL